MAVENVENTNKSLILLMFSWFFGCGKPVTNFRTKCGEVRRKTRRTTKFCRKEEKSHFLSFLDFSTKSCGNRNFFRVFPQGDNFVSLYFVFFWLFHKVCRSPLKPIKSTLRRFFQKQYPRKFQHILNIVENMLIISKTFHKFIIY